MKTEEAFLQAILANPADDAARLVYADFLEERGDPRAPFVRRHPEIYHALAAFEKDRRSPLDLVDHLAQEGRTDLLRGLALVLEGHRLHEPLRPLISSLGDNLLDGIAHALARAPNRSSSAAALEVHAARPQQPDRDRELASRLASTQAPEDVFTLLKGPHPSAVEEVLACLVQEMVLRGAALEVEPTVGRFVEGLGEHHPLAPLPLHLFDVDVPELLPFYGARCTTGASVQNLDPSEGMPPLPRGGGTAATLSRLDEPQCEQRITEVVRAWWNGSNGQFEAAVYRAQRPLSGGELSLSLLQCLGLESLADVAEGQSAQRIPARRAFGCLFTAAAGGGAYTRGLYGAYGRRAAWRSLAGLVGAPESADVRAVAGLANRCMWLSFGPPGSWFHDIAWDVGLLAVRPDGQTLAVLAATDTD